MAKKIIRFGVIGLGLMGREFGSVAARWMHLLDLDFQPVITGICDRMLALNYGEMIGTGIPREVIRDPRVIEAYIGQGHAH